MLPPAPAVGDGVLDVPPPLPPPSGEVARLAATEGASAGTRLRVLGVPECARLTTIAGAVSFLMVTFTSRSARHITFAAGGENITDAVYITLRSNASLRVAHCSPPRHIIGACATSFDRLRSTSLTKSHHCAQRTKLGYSTRLTAVVTIAPSAPGITLIRTER